MDQPPQIPPAVIQFAKENNIKNLQKDDIFYIKKEIFQYKNIDEAYYGFRKNTPNFKEQEDKIYTHCTYVLVEGEHIRIATPEETEQLNQVLCL